MKQSVLSGFAVVCALTAGAAFAGGDIFLDFELPETDTTLVAEQGYGGFTWSQQGAGLDLALMNINWYQTTYGASLNALSGDQVGWNDSGLDNVSADFGKDMIVDSGNWSPWLGFGPSSLTIELYNDGNLVGTFSQAMVENQWTHFDFNDTIADRMVIRNFGNSQWWLMDDILIRQVPGPGAVALLGLAGMMAHRRRRSA